MGLTNFRIIINNKLAGMGMPDREALLQLNDLGFKGILTLTKEPLCYDELKYFDYFHIPLHEFKAPFLDQMAEAVEFIDSVDGAVAVHCQFGKSKTGCILGAYLIYRYNYTADEAVRKLKQIFDGYIELSEQYEALRDFERFLRAKSFFEDSCSGKLELKKYNSVFEERVKHLKVCVYDEETEIILKTDNGEISLKLKGELSRKITKNICHI